MDAIKPIKLVKPVSGSARQEIDDSSAQPSRAARVQSIISVPVKADGIDFAGGRMVLNGQEMSDVIRGMVENQPSTLAALASQIEDYKKKRLRRRNQLVAKNPQLAKKEDEELGKLFAACDAHIEQIGRHIQRRFNQTRDGFAVEFDEDGQLIMNGMNIHALIERSRTDATEKSRLFLKGIRRRLELMLANKSGTPAFEKIRDVVEILTKDIDNLIS